MSFKLSKRAFQTIVEPWDPAVNKALQTIQMKDPSLVTNVEKIIVHPGGGSGQLGHVEMGLSKNPREVHIFKDRIQQIVVQRAGGPQSTLTPQELEQAIVKGIMETLAHEFSHIGKSRTPDQITQGPFLGEPEAEREAETFMRKVRSFDLSKRSEVSNILENLRIKFASNCPFVDPNLKFTSYIANNDLYAATKEALNIFKFKNTKPITLEIKEAIDFNTEVSKCKPVIRMLGTISKSLNTNNFVNANFVFKLASWQAANKLIPTGKLDKDTTNKFANPKHQGSLPRNFAIVIPGVLYRGGIIDNAQQLQHLKIMGIKRVVSLHADSEVPKMCDALGIEYVPAFIENGAPEEFGRQVLGDSVSEFLTQKPTYIHCFFGSDRTGGVIAKLRTEMGWSCDLAYREAKSYGFKDMFVDLIDWFSESCDKKPIDTDKMRKMLGDKEPYENPEEDEEQFCLMPTPAPDDVPFPSSSPGYSTYITSPTPVGISSVPMGLRI